MVYEPRLSGGKTDIERLNAALRQDPKLFARLLKHARDYLAREFPASLTERRPPYAR
jgi:hypothetical protein